MTKRGFVVHWNGPPANCVGADHARCERFWGGVKAYHGQTFGAKWAETSLYSFGVCPHGTRFTGCGWDRNQAANGTDQVGAFDGRDSEWFTVCVFLGEGEKPTPEMVEGVRSLIAEGRRTGRCARRVLPHNAFKRKTCPGPEFTALTREWDNADLDAPATTTSEEDEMYPLIKDMYRLWGRDVLKDIDGLRFWLRHGKQVGEPQLLDDINAALAKAAGF